MHDQEEIKGNSGEIRRSRLSSNMNKKKLELFRERIKKNFNVSNLTTRIVNVTEDESETTSTDQIFHLIDFPDAGRAYTVLKVDFWSQYKKIKRLGEGTTGTVYKCQEVATGNMYAVKCVRTRDEELIFLMENEFKNISQIRNPGIIEVYKMFVDKISGYVYILMEYFKGKEMFEIISQRPYTENDSKCIFKSILKSIMFLHSCGIIHRDLKPNNILVEDCLENVKIADFNVAKFSDKYKDYSKLKRKKL